MNHQLQARTSVAGAAAALLAALCAPAPATAAAKHFACANATVCVASNNTTGMAVSGTSQSGYGLYGVSNLGVGVAALSHSTTASALLGWNDSGGSAITALAAGSSPGIYLSQSGTGYGLQVGTTNGSAVSAAATSGDAIDAASISGTGVNVSSTQGAAIVSESPSYGLATLATAYKGVGVLGHDISVGGQGQGILGISDTGIGGYFANGSGDEHPALSVYGGTTGGGWGLATFASSDRYIQQTFFDDGTLEINGQLYTSGACHYGCSKSRHTRTYTPRTAEPTLDDDGEAQLVNGQAQVRLDPAFANVMDGARTYLVSVTPEGQSHGLYVAERDSRGFTVRENTPAVANIAFTYHIVARPYGVADRRLPTIVAAPLPAVVVPHFARPHTRR